MARPNEASKYAEELLKPNIFNAFEAILRDVEKGVEDSATQNTFIESEVPLFYSLINISKTTRAKFINVESLVEHLNIFQRYGILKAIMTKY